MRAQKRGHPAELAKTRREVEKLNKARESKLVNRGGSKQPPHRGMVRRGHVRPAAAPSVSRGCDQATASTPATEVRCIVRPESAEYGITRCNAPQLSQTTRSPSCQ